MLSMSRSTNLLRTAINARAFTTAFTRATRTPALASLSSVVSSSSSSASPTTLSSLRLSSPASSLPHRRTIVHNVLTDDDLRALLEKSTDKLVIVDWTASWCGPCKQIAPIYESLSDAHSNVVFIKADIDTLQDASVEAGVQSVPTFHFIKNSELVAEFSGADQNKLRALIKQHA